jgi:cytolysin (calcineurin-like family phosphatase)
MTTNNKQQILHQITAIAAMERGKLSAYSFKERSGHNGPYHKLQSWQDGKNHTHYVPADELPAVQAALAGYAQYQELTRQYADLVIAETRQNIAALKKKTKSPPTSSSPKMRKSNN